MSTGADSGGWKTAWEGWYRIRVSQTASSADAHTHEEYNKKDERIWTAGERVSFWWSLPFWERKEKASDPDSDPDSDHLWYCLNFQFWENKEEASDCDITEQTHEKWNGAQAVTRTQTQDIFLSFLKRIHRDWVLIKFLYYQNFTSDIHWYVCTGGVRDVLVFLSES